MTDYRQKLVRRRGPSPKVWEIEVDGAKQTTRSGKLGAPGQERTKSFPTSQEALEAARRATQKKVEEGYIDPDVSSTPPPARQVPRLTVTLEEGCEPTALVDRIGGVPNAPSPDFPWPTRSLGPLQLVAQLVGKAGGGELDLADVSVVQIFADMNGDYYEENAVLMHRGPCTEVLQVPPGVGVIPARRMRFTPDADDAILVLIEDPVFDERADDYSLRPGEYEAASSHAWCDKVWGVPVGANMPAEVLDSRGQRMKLLLLLESFDDWFVWALFVDASFRESKLIVVRA